MAKPERFVLFDGTQVSRELIEEKGIESVSELVNPEVVRRANAWFDEHNDKIRILHRNSKIEEGYLFILVWYQPL